MGARVYLTNSEIKSALNRFHGAIGPSAALLGISTRTLQRRIEASPSLTETAYQARETLTDYAEETLYKLAASGHFRSMTYFLETHARDRGYGLRRVTTTVAKPDIDTRWSK